MTVRHQPRVATMAGRIQTATEAIAATNHEPWMTDAACTRTDPELWFPDDNPSAYEKATAKDICLNQCPVRDECLAYALNNPTVARFGIWGGTNEHQRRALRRAGRAS